MLDRTQADLMLSLQARMNARVNPQWVSAGYPYLRAIVIEGAEAMEHHGWKWWKKQTCDLEQLRMELVDIWHFILSHLLLEHDGDESAAAQQLLRLLVPVDRLLFDQREYRFAELDSLEKLELTIGLASARRVSLPLFAGLLADCGMDWEELFRQYVGKNVLNLFRQDHGYQEGHYRKTWADGREDNLHLVDVMAALDSSAGDFQERLYTELKARYEAATATDTV